MNRGDWQWDDYPRLSETHPTSGSDTSWPAVPPPRRMPGWLAVIVRPIARAFRTAGRLARRAEPVAYALYHEARHRYHARGSSLGQALVLFSSAEQANDYARAESLAGYLSAAMQPSTIAARFDELQSVDIRCFLLDPMMDGQYATLQPWLGPDVALIAPQLRRALRQSQAQWRRIRGRAMRTTRGRRTRQTVAGGAAFRLATEAHRHYRFNEAIAGYAEAAQLDPTLAGRAYVEIGDLRRIRRRFDDARAYYEKALAEFGDDARHAEAARACAGIGQCRIATDESPEAIDEAIRAYETALARSQEIPRLGLALVRLLVQRRRFQEAGRVLRDLQDEHPQDPAILNEVATWLSLDRSFTAAQIVRKRIARLRPDDATNLLQLADLCAILGKVQEGYDAYARAIARRPEPHVVLRFHLFCLRQGVRALHARRAIDAVQCFRTIVRSHPESATAHLGLAFALEMLDDATNIVIDESGVRPVISGDRMAEADAERARALQLHADPQAEPSDVTVDALLDDIRRQIHEPDLAVELESLLVEPIDDSGSGERDDPLEGSL